jgi:hypothetical protein
MDPYVIIIYAVVCLPFADTWCKQKNRRRFFENFAKTNGFDPLLPDNWYLQDSKKIMKIRVLNFLEKQWIFNTIIRVHNKFCHITTIAFNKHCLTSILTLDWTQLNYSSLVVDWKQINYGSRV